MVPVTDRSQRESEVCAARALQSRAGSQPPTTLRPTAALFGLYFSATGNNAPLLTFYRMRVRWNESQTTASVDALRPVTDR